VSLLLPADRRRHASHDGDQRLVVSPQLENSAFNLGEEMFNGAVRFGNRLKKLYFITYIYRLRRGGPMLLLAARRQWLSSDWRADSSWCESVPPPLVLSAVALAYSPAPPHHEPFREILGFLRKLLA
jgi:hypothetical protein